MRGAERECGERERGPTSAGPGGGAFARAAGRGAGPAARCCGEDRPSRSAVWPVGRTQAAGASTTVSIEPRVPIDVVAVRDGALPDGTAAPSSAITVDR